MEIKAHDVAIKKVQDMAKDKKRPLTEADVRSINKIILKEPFLKRAINPDGIETQKRIEPGKYKSTPNHVRVPSGKLHKFVEPEEVPVAMEKLIRWFNKEIASSPTFITSFLTKLHHDFINIHPFDDGNGRVCRILLNYALLKLNYPPIVIKSTDRDNYITTLQKADTGNIAPLELYLGQNLIQWLKIGINAAKGKDISEPSDIDKEVDLFVRTKKYQCGVRRY